MKKVNRVPTVPRVPKVPRVGDRTPLEEVLFQFASGLSGAFENNDASMTDAEANAFVREKLKRAQKWYGPRLCGIRADRPGSVPGLAIGKDIELNREDREIYIGDAVYKMDDETDSLVYSMHRNWREKQKRRAHVEYVMFDIGLTAIFITTLLGSVLLSVHGINKTDKAVQKEKVIQARKDSLRMINTIQYKENSTERY